MTTRIVIVGGGFAGLSTAMHLSRHINTKDKVDIVLIDSRTKHVYLPLIYEVASGGFDGKDIECELESSTSFPFNLNEGILNNEIVRFRQGIVVNVDADTHNVELESGATIPFDYLVLAMGATNSTFGIKGADKNAISLTSLDNALSIRKQCSILIEECKKDLRDNIDIVIVGGGPNGVEVASEITSAINALYKGRAIPCSRTITIVDAGPRLLVMLNNFGSWLVKRRMKKLGINVANGTFVKEVKNNSVIVEPNKELKNVSPYKKSSVIKSDLTIWAGGFKARMEWKKWGLPVNKRGYILVDPTLQVHGMGSIFVAGDSASIMGRKIQQRAPEAIEQGKIVAENLIRLVRGHGMLREHKEVIWPFAIPLGGVNAVGKVGFITFFGIVGYTIRKAIDLKYFLSILSIWRAFKVWFKGGKIYLEND